MLHAPLAGKKQMQSSRAPILLRVSPAGKRRPAKGNFLYESISPTGTDFLKCKLGELGRTSVFNGMKGQKGTTHASMMQGNSMEVTSALMPSGSEHAWTHKCTFPPSLKFLGSSTCSSPSSSAPLQSFLNHFCTAKITFRA